MPVNVCYLQSAVQEFLSGRDDKSATPSVGEYKEMLKDALTTAGKIRNNHRTNFVIKLKNEVVNIFFKYIHVCYFQY